jgi:hypothetical protein
MAKEMDCLARRAMFNNQNPIPARLVEAAADFVASGFISDAVDFYSKAGDMTGLEDLLPRAVEDGDYFLLVKIRRALKEPVRSDELERLAERAETLGKKTFAAQARDHAADLKSGTT